MGNCSEAQENCNDNVLSPLAGNYDAYYVLTTNPDPDPPTLPDTYLGSKTLLKQIGAESTWQGTNDDVPSNFAATGDWMHNARPNLERVINAGVRTIVYDGDVVRSRPVVVVLTAVLTRGCGACVCRTTS